MAEGGRTGIVSHSMTRLDGTPMSEGGPVPSAIQLPADRNYMPPVYKGDKNCSGRLVPAEDDGMRDPKDVWELVPESQPAEFCWGLGPDVMVSRQDVMMFLKSCSGWSSSVRLGVETFEEIPAFMYAFTPDARQGFPCHASLQAEIGLSVTSIVADGLQTFLGDNHRGRTISVSREGLEVVIRVGPEPENISEMHSSVVSVGSRKYLAAPSMDGGYLTTSSLDVDRDSLENQENDLASYMEAKFLVGPVPCTDKMDYTLADTESAWPQLGLIAMLTAAPFSYGLSAVMAGSTAMGVGFSRWKSLCKRRALVQPKLKMTGPDGTLETLELPRHELEILDCLTENERQAGARQLAERFRGQKDAVVVSLGRVSKGSVNPIVAAMTTGAYVKVACAMMGSERIGKRSLQLVEVRGRRGCAVQISRCGEQCTIS